VERAEQALRSALSGAAIAVRDLRVRDLGDVARVEVDAAAVEDVRLCAPVLDAVRAAGFGAVTIEVQPFRSGSMNALLDPTPSAG
jgi:uncharacterized protein